MLDQYLCALSEDLGDPDILALEAPLEDDRIQENLVRVRRTSVALKQDYVSNAGRETSPHPHVYLYLLALEETLLEQLSGSGGTFSDTDYLPFPVGY